MSQSANKGRGVKRGTKKAGADAANSSSDSSVLEADSIQKDIQAIKIGLDETVKKSDLQDVLGQMVKQSDIEQLVHKVVKAVITETRESIKKEVVAEVEEEIERRLRERTGKLSDRVDSLEMNVHNLTDKIVQQNIVIEKLKESNEDLMSKCNSGIKMANYNEQYSRKNNIKIMNWKEGSDGDLREQFIAKMKESVNLDVKPQEVVAIHRIPGKQGFPKPVLVKLFNADAKIKVLKKRKELKGTYKVVEDVTKHNMGLINRLNNHERIEQAYYFNGSVYGRTLEGTRHKFDIFDDIDSKLPRRK